MDKMIIVNEEIEQNDIPVTEESLMSLEKLDRTSPDLWPDEDISKFVAHNLPQVNTPSFATNLTADDMNQIYVLGRLSVRELVLEVKKLHDSAYQLGVEEAKEMTRGRFLDVFNNNQ